MRITPSKIIARLNKQNIPLFEWSGRFPVAILDGEAAYQFKNDDDAKKITLPGLTLRVIQERFSRGRYYDSVLVMRESFISRLVQKYYANLPRLIEKTLAFEKRYFQVRTQEGEMIPTKSLTGILAGTFLLTE